MEQEYKFVYTADEGEVSSLGFTLIEKARSLAEAPISTFKVGAVGLAESGQVYLGVNVEFEGLPLHHSIHAEQFLVTNLALNSEKELTYLAISANGTDFSAPCGHCRQFYLEMRNAPQIQILYKRTDKNVNEFMSLESLMPVRFGPGSKSGGYPLLLEEQNNNLVLANPDSVEESCPDPDDSDDYLEHRALAASNRSYAPYSKCPSGVALVCKEEVYRGWYIESIAYNPSLGPVQAALVDFMARGKGKKFEEIEKVLLVELKDAKVSQEATAKILLEKISPNCGFKVLHCDKMPLQN